MTEILLDASLQPLPLTWPESARPDRKEVATDPEKPWRTKWVTRDILSSAVPDEAAAYHKGYFGYLELAYNAHRGIVIGPTHVWYTVLAELAGHVKANAEHYRALFTDSPGKKDIVVHGDAEVDVDPRAFVDQLRALVPVGADLFLPTFTTADEAYDIAASAAFCDAVSPYYNYMMMCCGIPRVRVEGTVEDWGNLLAHLDAVAGRLDLAKAWFALVRSHVAKIRAAAAGEVDVAFWKDIYHTERCGSGSQVEVSGWFTAFAMDPPSVTFPENFPTHTSKVEVTQVETGRKYLFTAGLFHSDVSGDFLVPRFGHLTERLPAVAEHTADTYTTVGLR